MQPDCGLTSSAAAGADWLDSNFRALIHPTSVSIRTRAQHWTPRRPSARSARRALVRASLVFTVASASLFAQAAVVAHALLVPHATCFEHGAVAHESGHAHAATAREVELAEAASAITARALPGDAHAIEDEHCSVLGTQHTSAPPVLAAPLAGRQLPAEPARAFAPALGTGRDAYRLAPKTSPPRA